MALDFSKIFPSQAAAFEAEKLAAQAKQAARVDALEIVNELIKLHTFIPSDFTFASTDTETVVKNKKAKKGEGATRIRTFYYVKATKELWFPAGVAAKNLPDGVTRDADNKLIVEPDKITVIQAMNKDEAKAKATAIA